MDYIIKIDKYIKDRFKIYNEEDDIVLVGEKSGDASSFFDAFVGETFSKGADFIFHDEKSELFKIERNFYDKNKEYKIYIKDKNIGSISSSINDDIVLNIEYGDEIFDLILDRENKELKIGDIGYIKSVKQGFKSYETMKLYLEDRKYLDILVVLAVYIWDVFIKYKIAFI